MQEREFLAATVKEVAQRAGVSVATVSKYMNGGTLREPYRIRVQKAVEELNYSINEVARNLKINRTYMVGILAPSIRSSFITTTISVMQKYLHDHGYVTIIFDYQDDEALEKKQFFELLRYQVEGVVLFPEHNETPIIEEAIERALPILLVDNLIDGILCDAVVTNSRESAYTLTRRIISCNHQKVAICAGPSEMYTARERLQGYLQAMKDYELEPQVINGYYSVEGSYKAIKNLLESEERPTALLSANYYMTLGALKAVNELGLRIPQDLSFAGFDELEFGCALPTEISTVVQPLEEVGVHAACRILSRIEKSDINPPYVDVLKTEITYTDSIRVL